MSLMVDSILLGLYLPIYCKSRCLLFSTQSELSCLTVLRGAISSKYTMKCKWSSRDRAMHKFVLQHHCHAFDLCLSYLNITLSHIWAWIIGAASYQHVSIFTHNSCIIACHSDNVREFSLQYRDTPGRRKQGLVRKNDANRYEKEVKSDRFVRLSPSCFFLFLIVAPLFTPCIIKVRLSRKQHIYRAQVSLKGTLVFFPPPTTCTAHISSRTWKPAENQKCTRFLSHSA